MGDAERAVLLVNPRARRAAEARSDAVLRALARRYAVEVRVADSAEALARAAGDAASAGVDAIFAAGGDGTVRLAAGAMAGSGAALGIIPAGTANDGASALGLPDDPLAAVERVVDVGPRALDLVDFGAGVFYTVGGLGVVAAAALRAAALRAAPGAARHVARAAGAGVYRLAATAALLSPAAAVRRYAVSYVTDAGVRRDERINAHGVFAANLPLCGGGLCVPGAGPPDDGAFDLCFVLPTLRPRLALRFARLAAGRPVPDAVRVVRAREAHFACESPDTLVGDGERLADGRVFHLRARHHALRVLA